MRPFAAISALLLVACQTQAALPVEELTPELRAELTSELTQTFETLMEGARNVDPAVFELAPQGDGFCVMQTNLLPCREVAQGFREAWTSDDPERLVRQEMDGLEYEVRIISPTLGYVASVTAENRAITGTGEIFRGSFASLGVWERLDGQWRMIASQQASWPVEGN